MVSELVVHSGVSVNRCGRVTIRASVSVGFVSRSGPGAPLVVQWFPGQTWTCSNSHSTGLLGLPLPLFLHFSEKLPGIFLEGGRDTALTLSASAPLQEGLGTSFAPRQSRCIFDVIGGAVRTFWVTAVLRSAFRVYFHSELLVYFLEKLLLD